MQTILWRIYLCLSEIFQLSTKYSPYWICFCIPSHATANMFHQICNITEACLGVKIFVSRTTGQIDRHTFTHTHAGHNNISFQALKSAHIHALLKISQQNYRTLPPTARGASCHLIPPPLDFCNNFCCKVDPVFIAEGNGSKMLCL